MKKTLLTTIIAFALTCVPANSAMVVVDYIGETFVGSNTIERNLIVNSDDGRNYDIAIRPLQEEITNNDGSVSLPLESFFINNNKEDVYFKYNEYSNIFYGASMDGVVKNMVAKVKDCGVIAAGTYSLMLEIQATDVDSGDVIVSSFNLQFLVPIIHELNTYSEAPNIKVGAENVFKKGHKVASETNPMIYIRSNTDWVLSIDTTNFGDTVGDYYIRTVSASEKVTSRLQEKALILPDREIILARGKAPADNEFVSIELSLETPADNVMKAGEYPNKIKYILREGQE